VLRPLDLEDLLSVLDADAGAPPCERATAVLSRCWMDDPDVVHDLTVGDREALLLHLRRLSLGERLNCLVRCPAEACGQQLELELLVNTLLVPAYDTVHRSYELSLELDGVRFDISFRLPTVRDLECSVALARSNPVDGAREIFRRCVLRAERNGEVHTAEALPEAVLTGVAAAMAEQDTQAEIELDLTCPACELVFSVVFDTATFFLRELEDRASRILREVHLLAQHYHWSEADIVRMSPRRRARYLELVLDERAPVLA
jgi:hypothetical protein